jgi:GTP-binding protein YchF
VSVGIGIIGLPKSGRTTVFNALTGGEAETGKYTGEGLSPHIGTAVVPEPRLKVLADTLRPGKVVPVTATYIDIGASVKGLVEDKGIGGQVLTQLTNTDALINVVRAFVDESVPHVEGNLDVDRDIANMNLELSFSDLALLERRLERIEISLKGAKPPERQNLLYEQGLLARLKDDLENETPIREVALTAEEVKAVSNYQFLTAKPLLIVVNIGESQLPETESMETGLRSRYARSRCHLIALCGKLEMELVQLDDEAAQELRSEFRMSESAVDRVIKSSYELLGLISFFSVASGEVRAWSIPGGTEAVKAAGKIHTDMERGFIRAEVINHEDLVKCGSIAEARKRGLLRLEGKNYIVQDGDVITFLFNV